LELAGAFLLAFLVMGGSVALALRFASAERKARDHLVDRIDAALRDLAARTSGQYHRGATYHHPVIGPIRYAGRVQGTTAGVSWFVKLAEGEDENDHQIEIGVLGVRRGHREEWRDDGLRVEVDEGVLRLWVDNSATRAADVARLEALLRRALELAERLMPSGAAGKSEGS
jgi:hypothetical protein